MIKQRIADRYTNEFELLVQTYMDMGLTRPHAENQALRDLNTTLQ